MDLFTGLVIGLHIGTVHIPASDHYNNVNPGIYARYDNGFTIGTYRNSYKRQSAYAGWTFEKGPFAMTVGAITGYQKKNVICAGDRMEKGYTHCWDGTHDSSIGPVIAPSVRLPSFAGLAPRLTFLPKLQSKDSSVFHLSVEHPF